MSVRVRDSLSGREVEVGEDGRVGIYVCGPTVYDHIHLGNARAPLFWDVVARYLKSREYEVKLVQNITDIDDKIINKANEEGISWEEISNRYTDSFHERLELLGIREPDVEPRATEHIPEMLSLIQELIEGGHAYAAPNGDVYYSVGSFADYGKLSHQRPGEMRETEKGAMSGKESPLDFALWKSSKPGEPSWESPWGPGRPGWHLECSAMVEKHLPGNPGADIHGGGTDLRFPHHENELAQSAAAHPDHAFVRAWAHHGMVNTGAEKMAKSVGNILDVEDAVARHGRNAIRMWLLQSHYSQPIDYSEEILEEKRRSYARLMRFCTAIFDSTSASELSAKLAKELREKFDDAMQNDFNTPEAVAAVFDAAGRAGREISERPEAASEFSSLKDALEEVLTILGFGLPERVQQHFHSRVNVFREAKRGGGEVERDGVLIRYEGTPEEEILQLIDQREAARREKNWEVADELRERMKLKGWTIEDKNPVYPSESLYPSSNLYPSGAKPFKHLYPSEYQR